MTVLAYLLHWPPAVMDAMPTAELMDWHTRAVDLHKQVNTPAKAR